MAEYGYCTHTRRGLSGCYPTISIARWIVPVRFQRAYDPVGSLGRRCSDAKGVLSRTCTRWKIALGNAEPREIRSIVSRKPGCRRATVHSYEAAIVWLA